eukprot:1411511-Alexandrium_andersonii.AAC.1
MPHGDMTLKTDNSQASPPHNPFPPPRPRRGAGWIRRGSKGDGSAASSSAQADPDSLSLSGIQSHLLEEEPPQTKGVSPLHSRRAVT